MSPTTYYILHLVALFVLTAYTFAAFANPDPARRKRTLMLTGIASLLVVISGFGLISKLYNNHFTGWMIVKAVCWLALSALAGIAYRRRGAVGALAGVALLLIAVAVIMVYTKPF